MELGQSLLHTFELLFTPLLASVECSTHGEMFIDEIIKTIKFHSFLEVTNKNDLKLVQTSVNAIIH